MKVIIYIFVILCSTHLAAQSELKYENYNETEGVGIGLVKVKTDILTIEKEPFSKESFTENIYTPKYVVPIFYKPDYGIFYAICTAIENGYYKILSATGEKYFVRQKEVTFVSWDNFLQQTTGISNKNWKNNPLRKSASVDSSPIKIRNAEAVFLVKKVKNNWMEIQDEDNTQQRGWIQWHKDNKLLINIYLLM